MPASSGSGFPFEHFGIEKWSEEDWRKELAYIDSEIIAAQGQMDYSQIPAFKNSAIYTPALSEAYVSAVEKLQLSDQIPFETRDLQFTNPKSKLCFYPWVLYSAGQAAKTKHLAQSENWVTRKKDDSRVVVISDSGGFQIQQQSIPFNNEETVLRMLNWQERISDYAMILDFPTGKISSGSMVPHIARLKREGVPIDELSSYLGFSTGYIACLVQTIRNNRTYIRERTLGATKMLNVIQGRNEKESRFWFERMKSFPFEGWAFAGGHSSQLSMMLRRIIQIRDYGLLQKCQWMHFLGVSTFKVAAALTYVQRAIRKHTDAPNLQITFDSKSPVDAVINGYEAVIGYDFDPKRWSFRPQKTNLSEYKNDERSLMELGREWQSGGDHRHIAQTGVGARIKLSQLVGMNKMGPLIPSREQQIMLTHHNTQAYFEGFRFACSYLDEKSILNRPPVIRHMASLINQVFQCENPMSFIDQASKELDAIAYEKI